MGHHNPTESMLPDEFRGEFEHFHFVAHVETHSGLVEHQRARFLGKSARDADPLPLTSGQRRDPSVAERNDVALRHRSFDCFAVGSRKAPDGSDVGKAPEHHSLMYPERECGLFPLRDNTNVSGKFSARPRRGLAPHRAHRSRLRY